MDKGKLSARIKAYNSQWELKLKAGDIIVPEKEKIGRPGEATLPELCLLASTVKRHNVKRFFEIGTFKGTTTLTIAANMEPDGHVYTLDVPIVPHDLDDKDKRWCQPENVGEVFRDIDGHKQKITQLWGDSRYFDFSTFYKKMDMVFVDASHSYEATVSDLKNAKKMIKPDGIIAVHDFAVWYPAIMSAVDDVMKETVYTFAWATVAMFGNGVERLFGD
jgi:predicted O-methyltransferase YrrM